MSQRLHEGDAAWFALGVKGGLLRIGAHAYLYTADPHQTTAWLVEGGAVAWPCWEYLPHAAAYVELIRAHGFPVNCVLFETPGREHNLDLDLAVVDASGSVQILGEAKKTAKELDTLLAGMTKHFSRNPGPPVGVRGARQAEWKLAYRLWVTRAPWLWLVGPSDRRRFRVSYDGELKLARVKDLPAPAEIGLAEDPAEHP